MNITKISPAPSSAAPAATASRSRACVRSQADGPVTSDASEDVTRQLIGDEQKSGSHDEGIGREGVSEKAGPRAPVAQRNQHGSEREALPDLDADVETHDVGDQTVRREREVLQL